MNWIKNTTIFTAALRSALLLCVFLFLVSFGHAELDEDGRLIVGDGTTPTVVTLDHVALGDLEGMWAIIINKEGTLVISPETMVYLGEGGMVAVQGTLQMESTLGTGLYSGSVAWDGISDFQPDKLTYLSLDGGTIEILKGDHDELVADTINISLGTEGGTFDIATGVVFESGAVYGESGGLTKTGEGTYRVGNVTMGGIFDVQAGNVVFLDGAMVGVLKSTAGTTISGLPIVEEEGEASESPSPGTKSDLMILERGSVVAGTLRDLGTLVFSKGGRITGTLADIDALVVGDGASHETLTLEGGAHTVGTIGINSGATLDIRGGTSIQLGGGDTEGNNEDILIYGGTLKISSAAETIGKAVGEGDTYITVYNGTIDVYRDHIELSLIDLVESDLHLRVVGSGEVIVANGVTFQSGAINHHPATEGADFTVSGGGTYKAAAVDIGEGYFIVESNTTMDFLETVAAKALIGQKGTLIHTHGDALFDEINLAGSYHGHNQNLTLRQGGVITGLISDVNVLALGGTLLLRVDDTETPTMSAKEWMILDPETVHVRTVSGANNGSYQKVIQVTGNETDKDHLQAVLNASRTALYRPEWFLNETDNTFLDLHLSILSVNDYIRYEWGQEGSNIDNVGGMLEEISRLPQVQEIYFREFLESLSEEQLQDILRNALAGELAGNALRMAMYQPAHSVFRYLDTTAPLRTPFQARGARMRGQVREGYHAWFNPYGQAEHAKRDADTFDGYNMTRYGFHLGGDVEIYNCAVAGAVFGYAAPSVKSDLGKITANDYTGGLYFRMPTVWEVIVNMMLGFGKQEYTYHNSSEKSTFYGRSLFGSVELSRPWSLSNNRLTPLIALDFQSAVMNDFMAYDPALGGILIQPEDLSSAVLRVGLLNEVWRLRTRLQYMRQIAGDDVGFSQTTVGGLATTRVRGTQWGKDWLNVGIGGELLKTRHWRIFADYNFDLGKHTTSHLGSLNSVFTW